MPRSGLLFLREMWRPIAIMTFGLGGLFAFALVAEAVRDKPAADIAVEEGGTVEGGASGLGRTIRVVVIED